MCFSFDAEPPPPPGAGTVPSGEAITLVAEDGNELLAWRAVAATPSGVGIVILPDVRGLFPFYQRLAEYFASVGIDAVTIDYFGRTAGTTARDEHFEFRPHVEQTTFAGVAADVAAGVAEVRSIGRASSIFTVGFCFGGSYSFMQAPVDSLDLAGVIGLYGGMRQRNEGAPTPITEAPNAKVPVLGLFGGADQSIPPEKIDEFRSGLAASGVDHSINVYPGAPHSFFDRSYADFSAECADAWRRMLDFIGQHARRG